MEILESKDRPARHPAIDFELQRAMEQGVDLTPWTGYTARQLREIRLALAEFKTADFLTDQPRDYLQMELLRLGRRSRVDISLCSDPAFDCNQMWEILEGLRAGIQVRRYADPKYSALQMRQIRFGIQDGLQTCAFEDPQLQPEQMLELRLKAPRLRFSKRFRAALRMLFPARSGRKVKRTRKGEKQNE